MSAQSPTNTGTGSASTPQPALDDLTKQVTAPPQWLQDAMSVPRSQGTVMADGCPINYFQWGDPTKPGLLMMHGFLAHARCFAFIAPYLAEDYNIVAFDLSGMGDSGARHSYPLETRVDEVLAVAAQTGLFAQQPDGKKPTLIAHSYGGHVALAVMEKASDRFDGLIICDLMTLRPERLMAYFGSSKPPGSQDPKRKNKVYPDYETAKGRFVLSPPQATEVPALFDYMAYHSLKQVEGGWTWKFDPSVFRRETDQHDHVFKQGETIVKTPGRKALIYGEQSLLFDADSAAYIRELGGTDLPIIGIPNARHHLMLDQPIAFATTLRTILAIWA
ncbi:MAG: alpha/beta hydrolase [Alphaproteobacteria bacterium]